MCLLVIYKVLAVNTGTGCGIANGNGDHVDDCTMGFCHQLRGNLQRRSLLLFFVPNPSSSQVLAVHASQNVAIDAEDVWTKC